MIRALRRALRATAVAIAVLALVDPVVVRHRADRPTVAVTGDGPVAARVRAALADRFDVVAGYWPGADALVLAGGGLTEAVAEWRGPAFAVVAAKGVTFERVLAPRRAGADAAVRVDVVARVRGAAGREVTFTARTGSVALDRVTRRVATDDEPLVLALAAPAPVIGVLPIRVEATMAGVAGPVAVADVVTQVESKPWRVLFHDARPSWMSTFVRRAIERDRRFEVASRIVTSVGVTSATPAAGRLATAADTYDVIVVGAPQELDTRDVAALDDFTRRRGGSVVLLLDGPDAGPAARLAGLSPAGGLRERSGPVAITEDGDTAAAPALVASELAWPAAIAPGAEPVVSAVASTRGDTARRPAVWAMPNGAGRVVVSGALDAWRFRDASRSRFDAFWRSLLAREAARALPPLDVRVEPEVARPGERVRVRVTLRDVTLAAATRDGPLAAAASVQAELIGSGIAPIPLRVVPDAAPGRLLALVRANVPPGAYDVRVIAGEAVATAHLVVTPDAAAPAGRQADAIATWVGSRGGAVIAERDAGALGARIASVVQLPARARPTHPMRSPWWLVAFALALAGEWYLRRRDALP